MKYNAIEVYYKNVHLFGREHFYMVNLVIHLVTYCHHFNLQINLAQLSLYAQDFATYCRIH
jgi:hypothetical protein